MFGVLIAAWGVSAKPHEIIKGCTAEPPAQYEEAPPQHGDLPRLLIGIVSGSSQATMERVVTSMQYMANEEFFPAWAIALYKGAVADWVGVETAAKNLKVKVEVYDAAHNLTCPFCPKLQFQIRMARMASEYDYVWLPDEDMSFANFAMLDFWDYHLVKGAPLIAQPTIMQHTQVTFFNVTHGPWAPCARWLKSVRTTFIEEQAPVFDTRFFAWLAPRLAEVAETQQEWGTDVGHDHLWCGGAKLYADAHGIPNPPCAVILVPIDHQDAHSVKKTDHFRETSQAFLARIEARHFNEVTNRLFDAAAALCRESADSSDPWFVQNNRIEVCLDAAGRYNWEHSWAS